MANIDVTDLLDDADFIDYFYVTRNQVAVDSHGRAQLGSSNRPKIWGVVQPASGRTMQLMTDYINVAGSIEIWTRFRLESATDTTQSDIVEWKGKLYRVAPMVHDFSNWGQGYVHVVCELTDMFPAAPTLTISDQDP
jgi:hypothetical protein